MQSSCQPIPIAYLYVSYPFYLSFLTRKSYCDSNKDDLITLAEFKAFILSSEAEWFSTLGYFSFSLYCFFAHLQAIKLTTPIELDMTATKAKPLTPEFIDATVIRVNETSATSLDMSGKNCFLLLLYFGQCITLICRLLIEGTAGRYFSKIASSEQD
jgi:hypothetical protein